MWEKKHVSSEEDEDSRSNKTSKNQTNRAIRSFMSMDSGVSDGEVGLHNCMHKS